MIKTYVIAANNTGAFVQAKFTDLVTKTLYPNHVSRWWHYLSGPIYIVKSNLTANQIYQIMKPHMVGIQFIVTEINNDNSQGWLPKKAWDWLEGK